MNTTRRSTNMPSWFSRTAQSPLHVEHDLEQNERVGKKHPQLVSMPILQGLTFVSWELREMRGGGGGGGKDSGTVV